jgi:hypothetical protein
MLMELLASLEGSALAAGLRSSKWIYPLVNAGHIVGIALLFGSIAAFDLRLMGAWHRVPLDALARVLVPVAGAGLMVTAVCGTLLFIVKATQYAASPLFQAKMIMLVIGLTNVLAYHFISRRLGWTSAGAVLVRPVPLQRLLGAVSLSVWLSVLVLGRLVGYF